ncbi:hypothetical protein CHU98_g2889 [Xylaria longipes]|nr:hypothetical protein CHU98_g2889 [Xylaria longipes]
MWRTLTFSVQGDIHKISKQTNHYRAPCHLATEDVYSPDLSVGDNPQPMGMARAVHWQWSTGSFSNASPTLKDPPDTGTFVDGISEFGNASSPTLEMHGLHNDGYALYAVADN